MTNSSRNQNLSLFWSIYVAADPKTRFYDRIPLTDKLLQPTKMKPTIKELKLAESVRKVCLENLQRSYEEAGISGLCHEGRWEYALDVLRNLSTENLLKDVSRPYRPSRRALNLQP
jgi:pentatricopeptide repeat protein